MKLHVPTGFFLCLPRKLNLQFRLEDLSHSRWAGNSICFRLSGADNSAFMWQRRSGGGWRNSRSRTERANEQTGGIRIQTLPRPSTYCKVLIPLNVRNWVRTEFDENLSRTIKLFTGSRRKVGFSPAPHILGAGSYTQSEGVLLKN